MCVCVCVHMKETLLVASVFCFLFLGHRLSLSQARTYRLCTAISLLSFLLSHTFAHTHTPTERSPDNENKKLGISYIRVYTHNAGVYVRMC